MIPVPQAAPFYDRLKLYQAGTIIGQGKIRKLNLSNAFTVTEDTANNQYNIDYSPASIHPLTVQTDVDTIKHSTTNNAGELLANNGTKYDRRAIGTAGQVPTVNPGATDWAWATPTVPATGFNPRQSRNALYEGSGGISGWHGFISSGILTIPSPATVATAFDTVFGRYEQWNTSTTAGSKGGFRTSVPVVMRQQTPRFLAKYNISTLANCKLKFALTDQSIYDNGALASSLANANGIVWGFDTGNATHEVVTNNGGATATSTTAGGTTTAANTFMIMEMILSPSTGANNLTWTFWSASTGKLSGTVTATLPSDTAQLFMHCYADNDSGSVKMGTFMVYLEVQDQTVFT